MTRQITGHNFRECVTPRRGQRQQEVRALFDAEELSRMTPQERLRLRRSLAELDNQDPFARTRDKRAKILLAVIIVCCIGLVSTSRCWQRLPRPAGRHGGAGRSSSSAS